MKISSKNISYLAVATSGHPSLEQLKLNFNFNELGSDDIKCLFDYQQSAKLHTLDLSFKGCGLPRNAFKRLATWLLESVEISHRLSLDFTL